MASWQKPDPSLVAMFDAALPLTQGVERRQMFGCPCAFLHGNMFAGLHEQRLIVRVPAEAALRPFQPMGRPMREYAAIEDALDLEPAQFRGWVQRALDHARTLPAKVKKPAAKQGAARKLAASSKQAAPAKQPAPAKKTARTAKPR
jgi:TfoX/Sxy family transcriptional regulator of competence genes